jgi:hypothetical protein
MEGCKNGFHLCARSLVLTVLTVLTRYDEGNALERGVLT